MSVVGPVMPGGASRGPEAPKRALPSADKIKRQAVILSKDQQLELQTTTHEMKAVHKTDAKELVPARRALGSEEDKKLLARANEVLEKQLPPSKEAREILTGVKGVELVQDQKGDYVIKIGMLSRPRAKGILDAIRKSATGESSMVKSEISNLLRTNPSFKKILDEAFEQAVKAYEASDKRYKEGLGYAGLNTHTPRERAEMDLHKVLDEYRDFTKLQKAKECVKLIDESDGKLKLVGSTFELNYDTGVKPHLDTIKHLHALLPDAHNLLSLLLTSPVLSSALKSKEFWGSSLGKELLESLKSNHDIFHDATPGTLALRLLDSCGDTLKVESTISASHTKLYLAPKKEGEKSADLPMVLEMIADKDRPESETKEVLERMSNSSWVNSACEKAGFGSFAQLNETFSDNARAIGDALQPLAQERIGQLKQFLTTEQGKEWGNANCLKIGQNEAIFSPEFNVQDVISKTNADGTTSCAVILQVTPRWGYIGDESAIKMHRMDKNEAFLAPFTITVELAKSPVSSSNDVSRLLDLVKEETAYEVVFISPDRKNFDANFNAIVAAIQYNLLPVIEELTAKAGGDRDNFTMRNQYKLNIEKRADGKANVIVEITPRYHLGFDYSNAQLTNLDSRKLELVLPDLEDWQYLESLVCIHMDDHENGGGGGNDAVTIAYLETLNTPNAKQTPVYTTLRERQQEDYSSQRGILTNIPKAQAATPDNLEERLQTLRDFEAEQGKAEIAATQSLEERLQALKDFEEDLKSGFVLPDAPTGVPQRETKKRREALGA